MRVSTVCYDTEQGLGFLVKAFHDHGVVTDPVVVHHGRRPSRLDWYPGAPRWTNIRDPKQLDDVKRAIAKTDVFLTFETPFDWSIFDFCRKEGIPSVMCPMIECMPRALPALPDLWLCPSLLDVQWAHAHGGGRPIVHLPVPVDTSLVPWQRRERAEVFVHNAGWGGLRGRNGTAEVLEAMEHVKSPAKFIIRSQEPLRLTANYRQQAQLTNPLVRRGHVPSLEQVEADLETGRDTPLQRMVEYRVGTFPQKGLWDEGDVFLFPDKFQGLSLPLQEAHAAGMLVMATDRFPSNTWLPREPLIAPASTHPASVSPRCVEIEEAVVDPREIARMVDAWHGRDISVFSEAGRAWAEANSWAVLGPSYRKVLEAML